MRLGAIITVVNYQTVPATTIILDFFGVFFFF